jgi:thiol-disulfide isomerase/thioredoxin
MKISFRPLLRIFVSGLAAALLARAEVMNTPVPGTTNAPQVEARADEVLKAMDAFYRGLTSLTLDVDVQLHMESEGMKQEIASGWGVALQRPNKLAINYKSGQNQFTFVCDGRLINVFIPMIKKYLEKPAPANLDTLFKEQSEPALLLQQGVPFFASLIAPDPRARLLEDVATVTYAGTEMWQGAACHRLHGAQSQFDWDLWIESGKQPLVRKALMDMGKSARRMAEKVPQMKQALWQIEIQFNQNMVNPTLTDDAFKFAPPATAKKVDSFRPKQNEEESPSPLIGKPAPAFELNLLDGTKLALAKHKDKDVVLLDFWATWCGPCRKSLPILANITEQFKDKGLVFYALNQRENPETIKDFLGKQPFKLTVALDAEGKVGEAYGVDGIPQTVLIDKTGVVRAVHIGYDPAMRVQLVKQIENLLAGPRPTPAGEVKPAKTEQK